MKAIEQYFHVVLFTILYKMVRTFSLWMKPKPTVWPFKWKRWNNLSSLFSLTSTLLNYWLWTSTEHDTDRHDLFTIVTAARGCTVSLGCSRRVDHRVIKMDLWPSFSQPNVREKQPLNIECSQFHCNTLTNITKANCWENSKWGEQCLGQITQVLCCF